MITVPPNDKGLRAAVDALIEDRVVAHPTETVYGLAVNPFSEDALDRLYAVKQRDPRHPVLVLVGAFDQLSELVASIPLSAQRCIDAFWPGPLSLLFKKSSRVPDRLTNPYGQVCVRLTSHPVARRLAVTFGHGITSSSANPSGEPPALMADQVPRSGVSVCIDGGACRSTVVSTVYDSEAGRILREGAVSRDELDAALGNS